MSRTKHGSKGPGFDFTSKRPGYKNGYGPDVKTITHRTERALENAGSWSEFRVRRCELCYTPLVYAEVNFCDGCMKKAIEPTRE